MATGELRSLYFAIEEDTSVFVGWDAVDENTLSAYQQMIGSSGVRVFTIDLRYPGQPIYEWGNGSVGWDTVSHECKEYLPKEVQMQLLTGAL